MSIDSTPRSVPGSSPASDVHNAAGKAAEGGTNTMTTTADKIHERQQKYVEGLRDRAIGAEIISAEAFVQSIRKLGYKSAATAADELIDNAIEAGAKNVHVAFGFGPDSDQKPTAIAFLDDGYGMVPGMVGAAARWGGTDRLGSRDMFGRFGFGLPSASVSQGRTFDVFSSVEGGDFYSVTVDVQAIVDGKYSSEDGRVLMPEAAVRPLPDWVIDYADKHFPGGASALSTVIVWSDFDALTWKTVTALETNFLQHFGLVYRGFLRTTSIMVNGKRVEPIDPLFTTEGYRFYEPPPEGAEAYPGLTIEVPDDDGNVLGVINVRYAYMPPDFLQRTTRGRGRRTPAQARMTIRAENNGLIFTRHGRQIDVVSKGLYTFQNNSRYAGVEIDFPASLDDLFGITTSKQHVTLSERAESLLRQHNVHTAIRAMQTRYEHEGKVAKAKAAEGDEETPRTSEKVMEEVSGILRQPPRSEEQEREAGENLTREVERIAKDTGLPVDVVAEEKQRETIHRPFKVELEKMIDGPFYRAEQRGGQLVITLNTAHRFYTDLYAPLDGYEGLRVRAGLELLLFVLGQSEVEHNTDGRIWYASERVDWSRKLNAVLTKLEDHIELIADAPSDDEAERSDVDGGEEDADAEA